MGTHGARPSNCYATKPFRFFSELPYGSVRRMKTPVPLMLLLASCTLLRANELEMFCAQATAFAPATPDSPDYRKYAPDREIDILHLTLDVTPDFKQRTVAGSATWKFKPIAKPFAE